MTDDMINALACVAAERRLLGTILQTPDVMPDVASIVDPSDFWRVEHEEVAKLIWGKHDAGDPITMLGIDDALRAGGLSPDKVVDIMAELLDSPPGNAEYHAKIVRQKAITRGLEGLGQRIIRDCVANTKTCEDIIASADDDVATMSARLVRDDEPKDAAEVMGEVFDRIDSRACGVIGGVRTGFADVDNIIGCMRDANLAVLAARPAVGKTALALNIASNVAFSCRVPTLFFSLEMERVDLVERLLSSRSGVSGRKFEVPAMLDARDMREAGRVRADMESGLLAIDDSPVRTVAQIGAIARLRKRRHGLGFILIDYLSLIDGRPRKGESRQEEVARTTRGLKTIARQLNVPLLLICQLNREVEKRGDGRPRLSDLRESGQIEQEASVVMMLHRDFDSPGEADLIVGKNRFGRTGLAKLAFHRECVRFDNMAFPGQINNGEWVE